MNHEELREKIACSACGGDGREHCNNPDHEFSYAIGGETRRLGCPLCKFPDSTLIVNGGKCEDCNGTGVSKDITVDAIMALFTKEKVRVRDIAYKTGYESGVSAGQSNVRQNEFPTNGDLNKGMK